ncbi:hypothetical protein BCS42_16695 [Crenothrix sp. D3]|jgi:diguanylate cyclase (GGDEF)-like protein|nr:hypothetical protein BCS42_16695 [Crenothrix sp. D3]
MFKTTTDIDDRLQQLRDEFVLSLPDQFANIDGLWAAVKQQGITQSHEADELHRAVHILAGSAGMFGQQRLGDIARTVEKSLHPLLYNNEIVIPTILSTIENDLLTLKNSVRSNLIIHEDFPTSPRYNNNPTTNIGLLANDEVLANSMARQLAIYGYPVQCCYNVDELETVFFNQTISALLVDIEQPSEGSLVSPALATRLLHLRQYDIPLIFISTQDDWDTRLAAVRMGAIAYFKKPVDCNVIANRLSKLTNREQQEKKRILIIEDDSLLAHHYADILRQADMLVEVLAQPPANVIHSISQLRPDLILMDLYMPTCTGLEMTSVIRQIEAYQGIPIVFLSTEPMKEKQRSAMLVGGDDFLQKPISDDDLVHAVSHRAERFRYLNALMVRDSLTGLLNHATLKNQLATLQAITLRYSSCLCFAMIDIDLFKAINDHYGHPKGDEVICSLAHLLKNRLRMSDVVGRYGGEEFAVILPNTELTSAVAIINDLRTYFEKITHYHESGIFNATFSAGIVTTAQCCSMQDLVDQADQALYTAKHQGRNCVATL